MGETNEGLNGNLEAVLPKSAELDVGTNMQVILPWLS